MLINDMLGCFSTEVVYVFSYNVTMKGVEDRALWLGENFEAEEKVLIVLGTCLMEQGSFNPQSKAVVEGSSTVSVCVWVGGCEDEIVN
jgi:Ni,Fe-hydrogenase III small subunit